MYTIQSLQSYCSILWLLAEEYVELNVSEVSFLMHFCDPVKLWLGVVAAKLQGPHLVLIMAHSKCVVVITQCHK